MFKFWTIKSTKKIRNDKSETRLMKSYVHKRKTGTRHCRLKIQKLTGININVNNINIIIIMLIIIALLASMEEKHY